MLEEANWQASWLFVHLDLSLDLNLDLKSCWLKIKVASSRSSSFICHLALSLSFLVRIRIRIRIRISLSRSQNWISQWFTQIEFVAREGETVSKWQPERGSKRWARGLSQALALALTQARAMFLALSGTTVGISYTSYFAH